MFDQERFIRRLEKVEDMSKKKQQKFINELTSSEFHQWWYGTGEVSRYDPITQPMRDEVLSGLSRPFALNAVIEFIRSHSSIDKSTLALFQQLTSAAMKTGSAHFNGTANAVETGHMDVSEASVRKDAYFKYLSMIDTMIDKSYKVRKYDLKDIARECRLPTYLVFVATMHTPDIQYHAKYKTTQSVNTALSEIYTYVSEGGIEGIDRINWEPLFVELLSEKYISNVAGCILMEGPNQINKYSKSKYYPDIRAVWDSLTKFALDKLNTATKEDRKQALDFIRKRLNLDSLSDLTNGQLRVNLLSLPGEYGNIIEDVKTKFDAKSPEEQKSTTHHNNDNRRDNRDRRPFDDNRNNRGYRNDDNRNRRDNRDRRPFDDNRDRQNRRDDNYRFNDREDNRNNRDGQRNDNYRDRNNRDRYDRYDNRDEEPKFNRNEGIRDIRKSSFINDEKSNKELIPPKYIVDEDPDNSILALYNYLEDDEEDDD